MYYTALLNVCVWKSVVRFKFIIACCAVQICSKYHKKSCPIINYWIQVFYYGNIRCCFRVCGCHHDIRTLFFSLSVRICSKRWRRCELVSFQCLSPFCCFAAVSVSQLRNWIYSARQIVNLWALEWKVTVIIVFATLVILAFLTESVHFVALTCKITALDFPRFSALIASVCVCFKFDIIY